MDLSVSSLSQSRFEETPLLPERLLPPISEVLASSTRKGRLWFEHNKDKLKKYARNPRPASPSPTRVFNSRPTVVPSRNFRSSRPAGQEISDSRFLLASLAEQVEILVGLVASVCESGNFLSDSLAVTLQRQSEIFSQTVNQTSEKIFRSEIFRAEILRKNLDQEKLVLRDLRRLQAQAAAHGIQDIPEISDPPSLPVPVPENELKSWMEEIRSEISDLKFRLSPRPVARSPSPPRSHRAVVVRSPRMQCSEISEISDVELEELQRARERLERQLEISTRDSST